MAVQTTKTNKPLNPRGQDQSPKGYNRAELYTGKALDFDGVNDSVETSAVPLPSAGAVSFYYQADATGGEIAECGGSTDDFRIIVNSLCGFYTGAEYRISTSGLWPIDDKFHFVVFTWGDFGTKFYLNGQFVKENTNRPADFSSVPTTLYIGVRDGSSNFFNGQIAGFKIFNTALTAAQVADLYNNPEKIVPTGVDNDALKLWLPMQEGAGTTAYDGSGNGNHGTINGATYTHGIGAPVSQTAVISWNKGTNLLAYSVWDNSYWTASGGVVTTGIEAPDGTTTAFKFERDDASSGTIYKVEPFGLDQNKYRYVYAKLPSGSASASAQLMSHNSNTNNTFTITDEWQRFELDSSPLIPANFYVVDFRAGVGVDEIHLWAPQATATNSPSVFVPTIGTAQTSDVLLPAGLTTGRDITGVNLFENVRKQGALNLDGNSWAEVHDNLSNDIEDEVTLECWYYHVQTTAINHLIGKRASSGGWLRIYSASSNTIKLERNGGSGSSNISITENAWNHIVATIDDADNMKIYINGTQQATSASFAPWSMNNGAPVSIGAWATSTTAIPPVNSRTTGEIAQPRIYNRALTAAEIQQNYNAGKNTYTN